MKRKLFFAAAICLLHFNTRATMFTIHVGDFAFSPAATPNVHVGDTVMWVWDSGSHTTTSTGIPAGAAAWDHDIKSSSPSFMYVPTVAGTYNFKCTPHASMGMTGSFTVIAAAGIATTAGDKQISVYPNPVSDVLNISLGDESTKALVTLTDMTGRQLSHMVISGQKQAAIALGAYANGQYWLSIEQNGKRFVQAVLVQH